MKAFFTLLFCLIVFSTVARAAQDDLTPVAKKLVFTGIADEVYAEENGLVRAPQKVSDFTYKQVDEVTVIVEGKSFSQLDNKKIEYHCEIEILGRGTIESGYDFDVTFCDLEI